MSENIIITDRKSAVALVKYERDRSKVVYSTYIEANSVTLDTVSDHVKALTELAFPEFVKGADAEVSANRKAFMNRVRNGLNHTLRKWEADAAARAESTETTSTGEDETGEDGTSPASQDDNSAATVTVADMSTAGLSSLAEDIVRELVRRAYADEADATLALQSIADGIDAAMSTDPGVIGSAA